MSQQTDDKGQAEIANTGNTSELIETLGTDVFHHHEIADRCHVINSMIDDFLRGHVAMDTQMLIWCEEAQSALCKVMNRASERGIHT